MLDQAISLLTGQNVLATGDVLEIGRRLREGDPSCGWMGDPSMSLVVDIEEYITDPDGKPIFPRMPNPYFGWFEVWAIDAFGVPYLSTRSPTCTPDLLRRLAEAHWTNGSATDRIVEKNRRAQVEQARIDRDRREEAHDKLHFALRKDVGAYVGGLSRRIY